MKSSKGNKVIEITGVFTQRKFRSDDGSYCVCLYRVKNEFVTLVGSDLPEVDYPVSFSGTWMSHPSFGEQFKVDMILNQLPSTKKDTISFILSTSSGITRSKAEAIVSCVDQSVFWDVLYANPKLLADGANVPESRILRLQAEVKRLTVQRDLFQLFGKDLAMNAQQCRRICTLFSDDLSKATENIQSNPYTLIHAGYTFACLDTFNQRRDYIPRNDYRRLLAAAQDLLLSAQSKCHVGLPTWDMVDQLESMLAPNGRMSRTDCQVFLRDACGKRDLIFSNNMFYLKRAYEEESAITRKLSAMAELPPRTIDRLTFQNVMRKYSADKSFALSTDQENAVWTAITRQICVITGGPGTGKSTILDAILFCWKELYGDTDWLLMAPTGKAAVRMTETTGQPAYTIHSTLQLDIQSGFNQMAEIGIKLEQSLLVVDESSMIDLSVASALVSSLAKAHSGTQHLILVGDPEQLPSVGYGNILSDLIGSGIIPVCTLNTIYRQAAENPIVTNSLRIRDDVDDLVWDRDFRRIHVGDDDANMEAACKFYLRCVNQFGIEHVALLSPFHNKTAISTNVLNKRLQATINPPAGRPSVKGIGVTFWENDRVMQLRNTDSLSNGDVGNIIQIDVSASGGDPCLYVEFENGFIQGYTREDLYQLDLAYGATRSLVKS